MKKFLCLVLTLTMLLSCFSMGLNVSAKGEKDNYYRPDGTVKPDGTVSEDIVGKVIDPILKAKDTEFAKNINELGYASVNDYAAKNKTITKETFNSFITENAGDKMFGVDYDFLYSKNSGAYFWSYSTFKLETNPHIHEEEVAEAEANKKRSTCALKGAYDACAEVLNGYDYDYSTKSIDKDIFDNIIETRVVVHNDYNGKDEIHYNYSYDFTKGDFALVRANANSQITNTICKVWNSNALFVDVATANKNAVAIANFIGTLLYPNFVKLPADTVVFTDNKKMDAYDFFLKVTEISGLDKILQDNWCNASTFDVKDVMYAFGVNIAENTLLNVETEKGEYMGARILTDMFRGFYKNPVLYVENLIQMFCKGYSYTYQRAFESLFALKYPVMSAKSRNGQYSQLDTYNGYELKSVDGLINFLADCIYVSKVDAGNKNATKFSFAPLPVNRLVNASDAEELHLYYLCYFELNRIYENNGVMIENFINNIITKLRALYVVADDTTEKDPVAETEMVLRSLFTGELTLVDVLSFHLDVLTQNTIDNFKPNFTSNIKNAIASLIQKFVDAMESFMNLLFGWTDGVFG